MSSQAKFVHQLLGFHITWRARTSPPRMTRQQRREAWRLSDLCVAFRVNHVEWQIRRGEYVRDDSWRPRA